MHELNEAYQSLPLEHYISISYQMRIANSPNVFLYNGLVGTYFEQPVSPGVRGIIHHGTQEKIRFQAPADFAKAELMMKEINSRKRYYLKIDFSLLKSEYLDVYKLPVLQYGRPDATIASGNLFRTPGNICQYFAGNMMCNFSVDLIDVVGCRYMLSNDNSSHKEMVKAVNAELIHRNIHPNPLDEDISSTETAVYIETWLFPGIYWDNSDMKK